MNRYLSLLFILTLLACTQPVSYSQTWESKIMPISITYDSSWYLLPSLDKESKILTGVIDMHNGTAYTIHITPDTDKETVNDEVYWNALKDEYLKGDSRSKLLSEKNTTFHGENYHQMIYLRYNKKWGIQKQITYVQRNGKKCTVVVLAFPTTPEQCETEPIPQRLVKLDANVKINEK